MTDPNEKLSLLLDDFTDDNDAGSLDEVIADVNLQYRVRRYRMIGETMRNELPPAIDTSFHSTVMAKIHDQAETPEHSPRSQARSESAAKHSILGWLSKPLAGLAIAATVAMVTVAIWQQDSRQPDDKLVEADQEKIKRLAQLPVQGGAVPVSTRVQTLGMRWKVEHETPGMQQKLNAYLVTHTEQAGSMQGLIPQARVAGFDAQQ